MLGRIALFEFRYQFASPLFRWAAALFLAAAFADMAVFKLLTPGGGNVLYNSPHAVIVSHLLVSVLFLFVGTAFVSSVIIRDDQTAFGPIIRTSRITRFDYLFGRFLGAFAIGAVIVATVTLGAWLGTLMPFADHAMLGPSQPAGFAYGLLVFALPNAFIISAILFALATATRSTAGTFIGVIALLLLYLVGQRLMEGQARLADIRVLADPFGMAAYMAASRYFTAAQLNAGAVPVTGLMLASRLLWLLLSLGCLALTYRFFRFSDPATPARRRRNRRPRQAARNRPPARVAAAATAGPRFGPGTARTQFLARLVLEMGFILKSPVFLILLGVAWVTALSALLGVPGWMGVPLRPLPSVVMPVIEGSYATLLIIIASYYGGELVWRERERGIHEIIDATALPAWALMLPKMLGLAFVLVAMVLIGITTGLLVQALAGDVPLSPGAFLLWGLLPMSVDAILVAVLAVFVQSLSPSKQAGWGVMVIYIIALLFAPTLGFEHPLWVYGRVPAVPLTGMDGAGIGWKAAWWFRLFWLEMAALLAVAAYLAWPRGTGQSLASRMRRARSGLAGPAGRIVLVAGVLHVATGAWIVYNTCVLDDGRGRDAQRYLADYEKRYFRFASLPQPSVEDVELDIALHPDEIRAEVRGRYRLVNRTGGPIEQVHVRLLDPTLELLGLDLPGARLERRDDAFGYRIYRLDAAMKPGEARSLWFRTRRAQAGFRAASPETDIAGNGSDLNTLQLTPRIGMSDVGLLEDPLARRKYGLPASPPLPRLDDDVAATRRAPGGDVVWTTADITVSTVADQTPIAPGKRVSERMVNGRRVARFVSATPVKNFFSVQSARYALRTQHDGQVEYAIHFHPDHHWNVDRMMTAMRASIAYYRQAFGPYPFEQLRIAERPDGGGGQAFPNTIAVGEGIFAMDLRDAAQIDMVSMLVAHELAHQWWGQQVAGARMEGGALLSESLSQYSALMVLKKLHGESMIRRFLQFQNHRYLSGRRTQALEERPLLRAGLDQDYINYGKGALALYLLQQRIGEDAVNRALRRFVERYRFAAAPYPRSLDLVAFLREEARRPADQALITDLFERITLYDLRVQPPTAARRPDGRWNVTVPVTAAKHHANGKGEEKTATLDEPIQIGLFTAVPGSPGFSRANVIHVDWQRVRTGDQVFHFVADTLPTAAGIDPYGSYIDRNPDDNVAAVQVAAPDDAGRR